MEAFWCKALPAREKLTPSAILSAILLAQGKSVLVTSHTTKALRMVRHHIVPELRPLCVSVLESDLDSRKQLESAVGSIAERLSRADAGSLEMEAKKLEVRAPGPCEEARRNPKSIDGGSRRRVSGDCDWWKVVGTR